MRVAIFALGFLTGQEMDRLPEAMRVLRDVLPEIEVTISSQYSPLLADALTKGKLDLAFMRAEPGMPDLTYQLVTEESLVAVLPSDHRLAALDEVDLGNWSARRSSPSQRRLPLSGQSSTSSYRNRAWIFIQVTRWIISRWRCLWECITQPCCRA